MIVSDDTLLGQGARLINAALDRLFAGPPQPEWVAIVVNVVGLFFIWAQLRSNQKSVRAAAKGADAAAVAARTALMSERPWIRHWFADDLTIDLTDGALEIFLKWKWENVGKTPAMGVLATLRLVPEDADLQSEIETAARLRSQADTIFPKQIVEVTEPLLLGPHNADADGGWRFHVVIVYAIPGEAGRRVTAQAYRLRKGIPSGSANRMYPNMANSWVAEINPVVMGYAVHT